MKIGKAVAIFLNINSEHYTLDEKGLAIYKVLSMPIHNSIKKSEMLAVIKFLFYKIWHLEEK